MSQSGINYQTVLDDLKAKRTKLDAAIEAIEEMLGHGSAPSKVELPTSGIYSNMTIAAAAIQFLRGVGSPQDTGSIVYSLRQGGLRTASKSPYRTIYNTLTSRLEKELTRSRGGKWGLTEWEKPTPTE